MTNPKRYRRYSGEFKREAIVRAGEEGVTDKAVCDELGISTRQFRRWRDELELLGKDAFPGPGPKPRHTRIDELWGAKTPAAYRTFVKAGPPGRRRPLRSATAR